MRTKVTPLSLFLAVGIVMFSANVFATGPQPEQNESVKYDLHASGAHLSLFKLFTLQPEKKNSGNRHIRTTKPASVKSPEADKKAAPSLQFAPLDRVRR